MNRKPYPSDLTDAQWAELAPLLPPKQTQHSRTVDLREVVNGVLYGCAAADALTTVWWYFRKWRRDAWDQDGFAQRRDIEHGEDHAGRCRQEGLAGRKRHIAVELQDLHHGLVVHAAIQAGIQLVLSGGPVSQTQSDLG